MRRGEWGKRKGWQDMRMSEGGQGEGKGKERTGKGKEREQRFTRNALLLFQRPTTNSQEVSQQLARGA